MTLNAAHGRGTAFHQAFVGRRRVLENLEAIAALVLAEAPDVVALQELDAPSAWSGGFDHLEHLAALTGYAHAFHGIHARFARPRIAYGTGVLSRHPLEAGESARFAKNALDTKGYVVARVRAPGGAVDVVSVHLDFKRTSERRRQLEDVSEHLACRGGGAPLVVAGDFNCPLDGRGDVLGAFARRHGLAAAEAPAPSFPARRPRRSLDHVLASAPLAIVEQRAILAAVSDHLPVLAVLDGARETPTPPDPGEALAAGA